MTEVAPTVMYSSYTPAQKKASQLYRENNKDKINAQRKLYYQARKERDPQFLEYKRIKSKEYYEKKKLSKVPVVVETVAPVEPVVPVEPVITTEPDVPIEPIVPVETVEKKKKKKKVKSV
jgi:hypothetical protein